MCPMKNCKTTSDEQHEIDPVTGWCTPCLTTRAADLIDALTVDDDARVALLDTLREEGEDFLALCWASDLIRGSTSELDRVIRRARITQHLMPASTLRGVLEALK
jgi:hypothetical protein